MKSRSIAVYLTAINTLAGFALSVAAAEDMQLTGLYDPGRAGESFAGLAVSDEAEKLSARPEE